MLGPLIGAGEIHCKVNILHVAKLKNTLALVQIVSKFSDPFHKTITW